MHNTKAPPARKKRKPPQRRTEQVLLTLQPADAAAIRIAAELLGMTVSGYVSRLVAVAGDPMQIARERDRIADSSRIAAAVSQVPEEVRRLRAELGRAGGLVKSFFVREDSSVLLADRHGKELTEALQVFTDAGRHAEEALATVHENLASVRADLERAVGQLCERP